MMCLCHHLITVLTIQAVLTVQDMIILLDNVCKCLKSLKYSPLQKNILYIKECLLTCGNAIMTNGDAATIRIIQHD